MKNEIELIREINKNLTIWNRIYGEFGAENNLNNIEASILYSILLFKECSQNDIVNEYSIPKQTVNNIIKRWQNKEYIMLEVDAKDRRKKVIKLTPKGIEYASLMLKPLHNKENLVASKMGIAKLSNLLGLINELNQELINAFEVNKKWFILIKN